AVLEEARGRALDLHVALHRSLARPRAPSVIGGLAEAAPAGPEHLAAPGERDPRLAPGGHGPQVVRLGYIRALAPAPVSQRIEHGRVPRRHEGLLSPAEEPQELLR